MDADDRLLTTAEVAAFFRVPASTVRGWRSEGRGPVGTLIGRRVLYRASAVTRFFESRETAEQQARAAAMTPH